MREIKFRAWNNVLNKMYSWNEFLDTNMKQTFIAPESTAMILMQYTGLKDKNGKEIYEGDIVKIDNDVASMFNIKSTGKVEYNNGLFLVRNGDEISILSSLFVLANTKYCLRGEVIGNIWENADLL